MHVTIGEAREHWPTATDNPKLCHCFIFRPEPRWESSQQLFRPHECPKAKFIPGCAYTMYAIGVAMNLS